MSPTSEGSLLDAARAEILAVGWRRTTLTGVARRAGVSRMTLYRTWPDMQTLLADLMTREWQGVAEEATDRPTEGAESPGTRDIAETVTTVARALRDNPLFAKIIAVDPEVLLPYLLDRRGRSQQAVLDLLDGAIAVGQAHGVVRRADPQRLARGVLLAAYGFTLSAPTMTETGPEPIDEDALFAELTTLLERYLQP